ncbi:MAG: helix-turn-helix domain-containing protein [Oscillospiraceae bacterium]|nr:helix-turn-helix domain-containing protein [Oscillospiraceae bacterium]
MNFTPDIVYLTLSIILDELSLYKPIVHKMRDPAERIRGIHYYSAEFFGTGSDYLFISSAGEDFSENCPRHLIISGDAVPEGLSEKTDTLIQIPGGIPIKTLLQTGHELVVFFTAWYNTLLMAILEHKPLNVFLDIAARKLANPIAVFDNNLSVISSAGAIPGPAGGTIWEKINSPGFVLDDFYTPQEIRRISGYIAHKDEQPHIILPKNDPAHSALAIHIWIDDKLYGGITLVDINEPFTDGQKELLAIVARMLKLYFQNHRIYLQIAENKTSWLNSLLDGAELSAEIISHYLNRFQWKIDDHFCVVTFTASAGLKIPIMSILDVRQINDRFPEALVTVYGECVVIVMRRPDNREPRGKDKQELEQFLKKDVMLRCGVSMIFKNFMNIRHYYIQSTFAAAQCKPLLSPTFCLYKDYQIDHVIKTLASGADLRCFCHPGILLLWESGDEAKRNLIHCLYHYFLNGKNISAAADALRIHRNTLIYRLNKVQEILNLDIRQPSPEQSFLFIMSCLIVPYL